MVTFVVLALVVVLGLALAAGVAAMVVVTLRRSGASSGTGPVGDGVLRPVPATARSFDVDLAGAPGLVSVGWFVSRTLTNATGGFATGPPGTVHVKARLGPAWPPITVLGPDARPGAPGIVVLPTGDPAFDARHVVLTTSPDPRPVLAVLNPQVRAMMLAGNVIQWQMGELSWLQVGYRDRAEEAACIEWATGLVRTAVVTSGIPVPRREGYSGGAPA